MEVLWEDDQMPIAPADIPVPTFEYDICSIHSRHFHVHLPGNTAECVNQSEDEQALYA